jgi:hypothetical protein
MKRPFAHFMIHIPRLCETWEFFSGYSANSAAAATDSPAAFTLY